MDFWSLIFLEGKGKAATFGNTKWAIKGPHRSLNDDSLVFRATWICEWSHEAANQVLKLLKPVFGPDYWLEYRKNRKRENRRLKTETAEYLKTRWKLTVVEHETMPSGNRHASWLTCQPAPGKTGFRSWIPVTITVAWRELVPTGTNKRNGNQMQIWLPFVFYTPRVRHIANGFD